MNVLVCQYLALVLLSLTCLTARGETPQVVVLRNGNILEGHVDHLGDTYRIDTGTSEIRLPEREVQRIVGTLHDAYVARRQEVREGVLVDRLELVTWCIRQELWAEAANELATARQLSPGHPEVAFVERRLEVASRAAMRVASEQLPTAPPAETADPQQQQAEVAQLEALAAKLPDGTLEDFARHVQPILVNGCAAVGCHSSNDPREFRLNRDLVRGVATRESTLRNLQAVWSVVDHEVPEHSPLLLQPSVPHGGMPRPVFGGHRTKVQEKLVEWVRQATATNPLLTDSNTASPVDELSLEDPTRRSSSAGEPLLADPSGIPTPSPQVSRAGYNQSLDDSPHFWEDPAARGLESDQPLPPGPSPVRYGVTPKRYAPRDEFDPELFNRQTQPAQPPAPSE